MLNRLKSILCHPSMLGLYIADKWRTCLAYLAFFFLVTIGLILTVDLNAKVFTYSDAREISNAIICDDELSGAGYDGTKLYGTTSQIETDNFLVYFDETAYKSSSLFTSGIIVVLGDDTANVYYGSIHLTEKSYEAFTEAWSVSEINQGNTTMHMLLTDFIYDIIKDANKGYRGVLLADDILSTVVYWLVCFGLSNVAAFFVNPFVERRYRRKLCMYTSMIFYFGIWLDIMYSMSFFMYVALVLPLVYTVIAFTHIKRIEVKRRNPDDNHRSN